MLVRQIEQRDLQSIAHIHKNVFSKEHFTSHFSVKMLFDYYTEILRLNPSSYLGEIDKEILGFVFSGRNTAASINRYIYRNCLKLTAIILRHPGFLIEKINARVERRFNSHADFRLLSIAVAGKQQSANIGGDLPNSVESSLRHDGIHEIGISVRKQNTKARNFYENYGFVQEGQTRYLYHYFKIL